MKRDSEKIKIAQAALGMAVLFGVAIWIVFSGTLLWFIRLSFVAFLLAIAILFTRFNRFS
jgi:hypothetical protein